jgi:hypothetical protein
VCVGARPLQWLELFKKSWSNRSFFDADIGAQQSLRQVDLEALSTSKSAPTKHRPSAAADNLEYVIKNGSTFGRLVTWAKCRISPLNWWNGSWKKRGNA